MTYVLVMSTNSDIIATQLKDSWDPIDDRYDWNAVKGGGLTIPAGATIVVLAHGNDTLIGNKGSDLNIGPKDFLKLIQNNVSGAPAAVYISTCGKGIAQFAAGVRLEAESQKIWAKTKIFGHSDPVAGSVPPASNLSWFEIL